MNLILEDPMVEILNFFNCLPIPKQNLNFSILLEIVKLIYTKDIRNLRESIVIFF